MRSLSVCSTLFTPAVLLSCLDSTSREDKDSIPEGANPGECIDGADNDLDGIYDCDRSGLLQRP